jgi:hypothetical protein
LVRVTLNKLLLSTFTFPKFKLGGFAPRRNVAATPVPLREIVSGEFGASLISETEPVMLPGEVGVNTTLNTALSPDAITAGTVRPAILKPVPETLTREIVTLPFPVLLNLMVCELFSPMTTLPKLALDGVVVRCPCTPVPLNPIVKLRSEASLVIAMLPGTSPVVTGAKWAAKLMLCPADSLNGVVSPLV